MFAVNQQKYDASYILTSLQFARKLFQYDTEVSSVELKLKSDVNIGSVKKKIQAILGDGFRVQDRYEQQVDTFRIMEIEKLISYLFLTFILMIACFNVIGSLSMLIIDKRADVVTLRNLGANDKLITRIFLLEGLYDFLLRSNHRGRIGIGFVLYPTGVWLDCVGRRLRSSPETLWWMPIRSVYMPGTLCWCSLRYWW